MFHSSCRFFIGCSKDDLLKEEQIIPEENVDHFEVIEDNQILNGLTTIGILKIVKKSDGYLIVDLVLISEMPHKAGIRFSKIDNQLNLVWTFMANENVDYISFRGLFELPNGEHIAILNELNGDGHEVFGLKFDNSGNIVWRKSYSATNVDYDTFKDEAIYFSNSGTSMKFMIVADSTYYHPDDAYYRELELNNDGDVVQENWIELINVNQFYTIMYDYTGNKYQYGVRLLLDYTIAGADYMSYDALLIKYDVSNSALFDKTFGIKKINDIFNKIVINSLNNPILVGVYGVDPSNQDEGEWISEINTAGEIVWEVKEFEPGYSYFGKDVIQDAEGNYLALFGKSKDGFNIATLSKISQQGEVLWKFADGIEGNTDFFSPEKVFADGNTYLLFGRNDLNKFWIKKIKHSK